MASNHWDPRTGRGRLNIMKRRLPQIRSANAKAIVRRAGPQKRWNFTDFVTGNTSGVGAVNQLFPILLASDYEDNQVQQKERVILDLVQLRAVHRQTPILGNPTASLHRFTLFTADLETATEVLSAALSPWLATASLWEEANTQLLRTWGYDLWAGAAPANTAVGQFGDNSNRVWTKSYRLKLRVKEPVGLYLLVNTTGIGTGQVSPFEFSYRIKLRSW